jgi:flavin reductase (DIM6/NTAB) family NADH-FMN oxidoreductase RutF
LANSLASLECRPWAEYDGGDHAIFVGEVMSITKADGNAAAFFKGKLGQYGDQ